MTTDAPAGTAPAAVQARNLRLPFPAPPRWPWRRAAQPSAAPGADGTRGGLVMTAGMPGQRAWLSWPGGQSAPVRLPAAGADRPTPARPRCRRASLASPWLVDAPPSVRAALRCRCQECEDVPR